MNKPECPPSYTFKLKPTQPTQTLAVHTSRDGVTLQFAHAAYRLTRQEAVDLANAIVDAVEYVKEADDDKQI